MDEEAIGFTPSAEFQEWISDLVRGKIDRFSVDTLIAMLGAAGAHVSVSVRRARAIA